MEVVEGKFGQMSGREFHTLKYQVGRVAFRCQKQTSSAVPANIHDERRLRCGS